eukprot:gb/GFBE01072795.1/.p1 GENE.gb/GFBE01072795.1/~~gb/GFBE01072795.1/.p1  ORF type:complete len:102 (+),score=9.82 gb/GFBE01072795.1/:1-306(+)
MHAYNRLPLALGASFLRAIHRPGIRARFATSRSVRVVSASEVEQSWFQRQPCDGIYAGHPLAVASSKRRGEVLACITRQVMALRHPDAVIEDAEDGRMVNG